MNKRVKLFVAVASILLIVIAVLTAVYLADRRHDGWFYDLEEQLTSKYDSIERIELYLARKNPTLFIYCDSIDLPSDSDVIVKDIKDILRIGSDNLFKSSYTGRNGDPIDSEYDLDFRVIIYSGDSLIEYSTGYYLGYDHTESGTIDRYRTWRREYGGETVAADCDDWFPTE